MKIGIWIEVVNDLTGTLRAVSCVITYARTLNLCYAAKITGDFVDSFRRIYSPVKRKLILFLKRVIFCSLHISE